ncbi:hypothetical protein FRB93_010477 [Tulasnella sp. JGI-2019a]|nr:hypothetical protein FRB93_010477 [Tulasnella sp. JGI-2019a]
MRKQLDSRLPVLISNNVKKNHRSFIVLVGDKAKDQVVNLHYLLSQARVSARPSVLWCYKKDLGFTTHRKKREARARKETKWGKREAGQQTAFELFLTVTDIRYTYYKESHKILGNTYGMCILQDFEAVTPNLLARTIETVEGGGIVVLMLKTMSSLRQLYTMSMDVHSRYRTSAHSDVVARFNERFILSLGSCEDCLVLDDELNVLPISRGKNISAIEDSDISKGKQSKAEIELKDLKESLLETKPVGELVKLARTLDQAKAILTFVDAIAEKTLSSTVTLTAARGRGKSAALGLAIAAALAHGYSNIFVTSPSPENLKTLFEFIFKGLDALGYEEHLDYDIAQSTNPDFNKAIVRVNVFKGHRQTIQYIQPQDAHVLGQAELVIIDEAAAIPLPLVRNLIGPYLVFMASTISGYEGTGRSLSLKLIQQLRESTRPSLTKDGVDAEAAANAPSVVKPAKNALAGSGSGAGSSLKARTLREIKLEEPIRYSIGDQVERWLNTLLCLDATILPPTTTQGTPHPSQCNLYSISRDTLFSFHPASELFLQRIMALYVSSHYKNSPNDLQLMSDAPAHQLFVLLPPLKDDQNTLPEPLVVIQVALEGRIAKQSILDSLSRGNRSDGDLIPWLMSMQFQDNHFAELSGARVVRVATHPDYISMGYGARALHALEAFYRGDYFDLSESEAVQAEYPRDHRLDQVQSLQDDTIAPRSINSLPPLLQPLNTLKPPALDYMGVSYGLTPQLLRFWKRAKYVPLYIRQTKNELTGECSCVMLRSLAGDDASPVQGFEEFVKDFRRRFLQLLGFGFRDFSSVMGLNVLEAVSNADKALASSSQELLTAELNILLSPFDIKRLESYANNMLDYHVIMDLLPTVAALYFEKRLGADVKLSAVQSSIMLSLGLQRKTVEDVEAELHIPVNQALALFVKSIRKICKRLQDIHREAISSTLPHAESVVLRADGATEWKELPQPLQEELEEAAMEVSEDMREKQKSMLQSLDISRFAIDDPMTDWAAAEAQISAMSSVTTDAQKARMSTVVSVKGMPKVGEEKRKTVEDDGGVPNRREKRKGGHQKGRDGHSSKKVKR